MDASESRVRWKSKRRWRYGRLADESSAQNGAVNVHDEYTGGMRTIPVVAVQHQVRGARGGRHWEPVQSVPEDDAASDESAEWDQLALFDLRGDAA